MAEMTRTDELVHSIERDGAFLAELQAAPTPETKRSVLDAHGFADLGPEDLRAYVEAHGGTVPSTEDGLQLTDRELEAVSGGMANNDPHIIQTSVAMAV